MTKHQAAAYAGMLDAGERLRAIITNARSKSYPLTLSDETIEHLGVALNALHAAQRSIES